jgi:hypothetical protein
MAVLERAKRGLARLLGTPSREDFLRCLPKHSVGAEIGVFRGEFTGHILTQVEPLGLHLIDAWWLLYGERYPDWGPYTDFGRLGTREAYAQAEAVVRRWDKRGVCRFHIGDSVGILETFEDHYFDWVYLDSSHEYEQSRRELDVLGRKVRSGGLITGDDWHEEPDHVHHGLARAVREFCQLHGWKIEGVDRFAQWRISEA